MDIFQEKKASTMDDESLGDALELSISESQRLIKREKGFQRIEWNFYKKLSLSI